MIIGIGSDIIDVMRIERTLEQYGERFTRRCFTDLERKKASSRLHQAPTYAKRFAAKHFSALILHSSAFIIGPHPLNIGFRPHR